jgi:hypothetical protein
MRAAARRFGFWNRACVRVDRDLEECVAYRDRAFDAYVAYATSVNSFGAPPSDIPHAD